MGSTVKQLDRSGWDDAALARDVQHKAERAAYRRFQAAKAEHPLANVLDGLSDRSRADSEAPRYRFSVTDFGNGHIEACVAREIPNVEKTLDKAIERDLRALTPRGDGDREKSREAAARRAKRKVRHLSKAMQVNALWTLTVRQNVTDRNRLLRYLDGFRRRVQALFPEWRYIAVLEKQERGAWHIHLATHALPSRIHANGVRVKSYPVMLAIWRSVTGSDGGSFNQSLGISKGKRGHRKQQRAGSIARYIAGYVAKDMLESELNRKRYSHSRGIELPESYKALFDGDTPMGELIELAYAAIGDKVAAAWFDQERGVFFIETDDSVPVQ